jgi:hypothetical protein
MFTYIPGMQYAAQTMMLWSAGNELADGHWMTALWDALGALLGTILETARANYCFAAETPIRVPGGWKCIRDLRPGDLVLTAPEDDPHAPVVARVVEDAFVGRARLWHLHVRGEVIRTSAAHRFYAWGKGWIAACTLKPGDLVRSDDGQWVAVDEICDSGIEEEVYNCRIADYHTYFVGKPEWGFSCWAHNACGGAENGGSRRGSNMTENAEAGRAREQRVRLELEAQYPSASVQGQRYLRDASGRRLKDPLTGEARRIDFAVVEKGRVIDLVEATSPTATKVAQTLKENRIKGLAEAFIRDLETGNLLSVMEIMTRLVRRE